MDRIIKQIKNAEGIEDIEAIEEQIDWAKNLCEQKLYQDKLENYACWKLEGSKWKEFEKLDIKIINAKIDQIGYHHAKNIELEIGSFKFCYYYSNSHVVYYNDCPFARLVFVHRNTKITILECHDSNEQCFYLDTQKYIEKCSKLIGLNHLTMKELGDIISLGEIEIDEWNECNPDWYLDI